jgi:arylsulfatase A-like enzyme
VLILAAGCSDPPPDPRNLLLISIDTLVPGRMSTYGGPRATTPHIDELAKRAVRFDNAFSTAPWTMPAHASMLTGLYPLSISSDKSERHFYQLAPMLAERFQAAQYATGAVTGGGYCSAAFGLDTGFDSFVEVDKLDETADSVEAFVEWLKTHQDRRFFFFFHTFAAHEPLLDRRYVGDADGGRLEDIYLPSDERRLQMMVCCTEMKVTNAEKEFMLRLYDGGVADADELVGDLIQALEKFSLLDKTDIVITSDHGQEFWQHTDRGGHGHSLYQELLRIPLIWYQPGMKTSGTAQAADVSLVDIVPTIVARFGLTTRDVFSGVDLGPLLNGHAWDVERTLFAESIHHGPERFSAWTPEAKLTITPDPQTQFNEMRFLGARNAVSVAAPTELFLRSDRLEINERGTSPRGSDLVADLSRELASHRSAPPVVSGKTRALAPNIQPDAKTTEELRALGYLE